MLINGQKVTDTALVSEGVPFTMQAVANTGYEFSSFSIPFTSIASQANPFTLTLTPQAYPGIHDNSELTLRTNFKRANQEPMPNAFFTATDDSAGILTNVTAGIKYSVDGGTQWMDITG